MSNHKKERQQRVVFADDHSRISPRSTEGLLALEASQVYSLISEVYNNTPLFSQFSKTWQQRIRVVRRYSTTSYIEDSVLTQWVEFFKRVLMPMEDRWESEHHRQLQSQTDSDQYYTALLIIHPALQAYTQKEASQGRSFSELTATLDQVREALRWCNTYERIRQNQFFSLYRAEHPEVVLSDCSYLQLREIIGNLSSFERRALLVRQIMSYEGADNFLNHKYRSDYQGQQGLLSLTERKLRDILNELKSMQFSGLLYNESGDLVARASNSD